MTRQMLKEALDLIPSDFADAPIFVLVGPSSMPNKCKIDPLLDKHGRPLMTCIYDAEIDGEGIAMVSWELMTDEMKIRSGRYGKVFSKIGIHFPGKSDDNDN